MHALHFPNPSQPSPLHFSPASFSFMLAPRTSSAFVCLRCEAQIAQRRLPAFARPSSHAKFSASTRRRDEAEELAVPPRAQQPKLKITREVTPLNRLRKRKGGKVIQETSANLGVKRLGDDADILVLREIANPIQESPKRSNLPNLPKSRTLLPRYRRRGKLSRQKRYTSRSRPCGRRMMAVPMIHIMSSRPPLSSLGKRL
jgi:hypothetical protein